MSAVSYVDQVRELNKQLSTIQAATSYQEVSSTIDKTQRILTTILTEQAGSRNFDQAVLTQFTFLQLLKEKAWISTSEYGVIFEKTLELGKTHHPSNDQEENEEFLDFLQCKMQELRSFQVSLVSSE